VPSAQHVVDAQAAPLCHRRADQVRERSIAGVSQAPGDVGRQPPLLTIRREVVRGGAHTHVEGEEILLLPRVRPVGIDAHREVLDHAKALDEHPSELIVEEQLQPGMKRDAVGVGGACHCRAVGMPELAGPLRPSRTMHLREGAEPCPAVERGPVLGSEPLEVVEHGGGVVRPEELECLVLSRPDSVAIDLGRVAP